MLKSTITKFTCTPRLIVLFFSGDFLNLTTTFIRLHLEGQTLSAVGGVFGRMAIFQMPGHANGVGVRSADDLSANDRTFSGGANDVANSFGILSVNARSGALAKLGVRFVEPLPEQVFASDNFLFIFR